MRYDVIIVGYGPAGMVLAPLLAQRGHRVAVLERYAGLYNLPRAATFDDETMRIFQKIGIADVVAAGTTPRLVYDWCNAEGRVLARHTFAERGLSGWPEFSMMYQPWLEDQLDGVCRNLSGVDVLHEHEVTGLRQDDREVIVETVTPQGLRSFTAQYVVGCDGGNSAVRELLGVALDDYGFCEPWLVCDFELKRSADGLPPALQLGDPAQPVSIFTIDDKHQRFAFMLDDRHEITEADVWRKVSRWLKPDEAVPIRVATYTFRSRSAQRWRDGRVFLAGDAAHEMPPFLGQGMCSGIRDTANLAWKLSLVLSAAASESLLDTYQVERAPHVRKITEKAIEMGRLQTIRDLAEARARDEVMLKARAAGDQPAAYAFPAYDAGFLSGSGSGRGRLFPQGRVRAADDAITRFDDVVGDGFHVVTLDPVAVGDLPVDVDLCVIAEGGVTDVDGVYPSWFSEHGCTTAVVRPDGYVFGTARDAAGLTRVLAELGERLDRPRRTRRMPS
ncbi:bifunctional 3-(3-hydroxy-phenyl)propionate/3-hydroxycinnamic acid hydroxylase [Amycolatopsis sp. cmx-4-83]|uniref:bifunctional 3-(3-hydroxy-phenyl)propionate/3-hydroxycinnamic acid hydroxylase n=1 Tax=Amycolatopsis sp. cmx-4-83 TaxID=2790940 RepID=UPI00397DEC4D